MSTSDITDIAWADMTKAGIDASQVRMRPTGTGGHEFTWAGADGARVSFGPAEATEDTETGASPRGWDLASYGEDGEQVSQEWHATAAETLQAAARHVAFCAAG